MNGLTYTERLRVWKYYVDWCLEHNLEICSENIIAYLSHQGFLDEKVIKRALKGVQNE